MTSERQRQQQRGEDVARRQKLDDGRRRRRPTPSVVVPESRGTQQAPKSTRLRARCSAASQPAFSPTTTGHPTQPSKIKKINPFWVKENTRARHSLTASKGMDAAGPHATPSFSCPPSRHLLPTPPFPPLMSTPQSSFNTSWWRLPAQHLSTLGTCCGMCRCTTHTSPRLSPGKQAQTSNGIHH